MINSRFSSARTFITQSEERFTRFSEESELARLNRSAGDWFQASAEMSEVLQEAQRLAIETDGLFNPPILPELKKAGYDRSLDEIKDSKPRIEPRTVIMKQDFRQVKPDKATNSVLLPTGMQVDLGGIAKGWIAEQAAQQLAKVSCACAVNAGGDIGHAIGRMVKMMKQMNRDHQEQDWDWPLLDGSLRHTMEKSE